MKFNLNHKELLALYDLLQVTLNAAPCRTIDDVQLRQVHSRLKACIVSAMSNCEQSTKDRLLQDLTGQVDSDLLSSEAAANNDLMQILTDNDDEVMAAPGYPRARKGPPAPNMPKPNKHRRHRH